MYGGWLCILHTGKDMHIANFRILNVISNRIGVLLQITAGSVRETPILQFFRQLLTQIRHDQFPILQRIGICTAEEQGFQSIRLGNSVLTKGTK